MPSHSDPSARLPVVLARSRPASSPAYAAQALGAGGERRGLRAGPVFVDVARSAYLRAQWAGGERRRAPGQAAAARV